LEEGVDKNYAREREDGEVASVDIPTKLLQDNCDYAFSTKGCNEHKGEWNTA
jgi:hypothetical protein